MHPFNNILVDSHLECYITRRMTPLDLFSLIFWSSIIFAATFIVHQTFYRGTATAKYLYAAIGLKLFGALSFTAIHKFYYGDGDTIAYFKRGSSISSKLYSDPQAFFDVMMMKSGDFSIWHSDILSVFNNSTIVPVIKLCAVLNVFSFQSIWGTAILFAALSTIGLWALFRVFNDLFPDLELQMAFSTLMVPSTFFWGSGIMKDTMVIACVGFLVAGFYYLFIKRSEFILSALLIAISISLIATLKIYVLFAIIPSLLIWFSLHYWQKIKTWELRTFAFIGTLVFVLPLVAIVYLLVGDLIISLFARQIIIATRYQLWHEVIQGANNSFYNLGHIDLSFFGLLMKAPAAINVALFRPYIFEIRSAIMVPSFVESSFYILGCLWVLFRAGFFGFFRIIFSNPALIAFSFFVLAMAYITGFTSFNFGALARYKIPLIPFFTAILFVVSAEASKRRLRKKQRL